MRRQQWESDGPVPTEKLIGYNIGDINKNDKYMNIYYSMSMQKRQSFMPASVAPAVRKQLREINIDREEIPPRV